VELEPVLLEEFTQPHPEPAAEAAAARWIANRMAKTRRATALESERSVRRWPGQPGNRVDGPIADFWQSRVVSGANQFFD
jgi:hypothetical protein